MHIAFLSVWGRYHGIAWLTSGSRQQEQLCKGPGAGVLEEQRGGPCDSHGCTGSWRENDRAPGHVQTGTISYLNIFNALFVKSKAMQPVDSEADCTLLFRSGSQALPVSSER